MRGRGICPTRACIARTAAWHRVTPEFISIAQGSPTSLHLHRCRRKVPCPITSYDLAR